MKDFSNCLPPNLQTLVVGYLTQVATLSWWEERSQSLATDFTNSHEFFFKSVKIRVNPWQKTGCLVKVAHGFFIKDDDFECYKPSE
jgi:hypothetical protein